MGFWYHQKASIVIIWITEEFRFSFQLAETDMKSKGNGHSIVMQEGWFLDAQIFKMDIYHHTSTEKFFKNWKTRNISKRYLIPEFVRGKRRRRVFDSLNCNVILVIRTYSITNSTRQLTSGMLIVCWICTSCKDSPHHTLMLWFLRYLWF